MPAKKSVAKSPPTSKRSVAPVPPPPPPKKPRCTVSEVLNVLAFASNQSAMIDSLREMTPSRAVLRESAKRLIELDRENLVEALVEHSEERGFRLSAEGGKRCPEVGETRVYSVQQSRRGPKLYINLPVNCLGIRAGSNLTARFEDGRVTVEPSGE